MNPTYWQTYMYIVLALVAIPGGLWLAFSGVKGWSNLMVKLADKFK